MRAGMLAFSAGDILLYQAGVLPPRVLLLGLAMLALAAGCWGPRPVHRAGFSILAMGLAGMLWGAWDASRMLADQLPAELEGREIPVTGFVCSEVEPADWGGKRFDFCTREGADNPATLPRRLRLSWYGPEAGQLAPVMRLRVRLKRPHGSVNTAGFRYERWLFRKGIGATGTVRERLAGPVPVCNGACRYHRWRNARIHSLRQSLPDTGVAALVPAITLGSRSAMTSAHWERLRVTGTSHLVAISGLHVGLIALIAAGLVRYPGLLLFGDRFGPRLVPRLVLSLSLLAALGYALLAGFGVPARRALIMTLVGGVYLYHGRLQRPWDGWLLALCLVLLMDPRAPLDPGFWLSFLAVAVLIFLFWGRPAPMGKLKGLLLTQFAITLLLWPVLTLQGLPASSGGFLANLLAIPWVSLVVMPLVLLCLPWLVAGQVPPDGLMAGLEGALSVLWWFLGAIEGLSASLDWTRLPVLPGALALLLLPALLWGLLPLGRGLRAALLGLVLAPVLAVQGKAGNRIVPPEVRVFDVGQGLAVLVREEDRALLYDTGPGRPEGFSTTRAMLVPSLRALGVRRLDWLVLSHGDSDHAGDWRAVTDAIAVDRIVSGQPQALGEGAVGACPQEDQSLALGRFRLSFWQAPRAGDDNGQSCLLHLDHPLGAILLPGDLDAGAEERWLASRAPASPVHLLIAGHHGSRTASSNVLVRQLRPRHVVYSAGYRNPYGHPHPEVRARFEGVGARQYSTAELGEIRFVMGEGWQAHWARQQAPFWIGD